VRGTILSYLDYVKADWPYAIYANGYHYVFKSQLRLNGGILGHSYQRDWT